MGLSRRQFLKCFGALTFAAPVLRALECRASQTPYSLDTLDQEIIRTVKQLKGARELNLRMLIPQGCRGNIQPIASKFTASTGVALDFREVPVDDINATILLETTSGNTDFDMALPATFGIPDLVEAGALLNLSEFARRYEPYSFREEALYSVGDYYKGELYGYQTDGDTYVMFYLKDWLDDATESLRFKDQYGYPLGVPKTWSELDSMIQFFHRPKENRWGGALFRTPNYIAWEWWIRFHSKGFLPVNDSFEPQINNEGGVRALEELIAVSSYLYPLAGTNGLFENWKSYAAGNIFCNIGWGGTQKYLNGPKSSIKGKLAFGLTPGGVFDGKPMNIPYFNWGWNYTVSSRCKEPEIAYLFALLACSPQCSTEAVREQSGYFDPFRLKHYDDDTIRETYSAEFLAVHRESMSKSIPDFYLKGQGEYFDVLREYLIHAYTGKLTPKKALDAVAKAWNLITRRMGKSSQLEQWRFLRSQYPRPFGKILR